MSILGHTFNIFFKFDKKKRSVGSKVKKVFNRGGDGKVKGGEWKVKSGK